MTALTAVLGGGTTAGLHRVAELDLDAARLETEDAGWIFAYVDGSALDTRESVLLAIGEAMFFPAYFTGRSLDGLHDCLLDLPGPTVLVWEGWGTLAGAHPPDLRRLLLVLADRTTEQPGFEVVLLGDGPADAAPPL
ncbi:MAG TPA: barstar family protein [Nocardioides sp.]|nr:barstar family protein [Nocardioides sp.]